MLAIYRREMGAFFTSGVAYVFLAVFWLVSGIFFYNGVVGNATTDTSALFSSMFYIVLFLIPVLTMKLLSEEKKNRTDQGLLTAPISLWDIVLGKYFAALTLFIIAESVVFIYAFILNYLGDVVWTPLIGNYVAMIFLGAAFIAVGLFVSSLTESQMASAVVSLVLLFVIYLSEVMVSNFQNGGKFKKAIYFVVSKLAFYSRYVEFTRGVFSLPSIVFFISAAFLFNFFTVKVLEKRRWS
ncbi:ABC transporter permease subunit [Ruminococcus flavefaciens]|jgi:ABC-2 type transport system permease protein|uniref:ABC transporter permease subunit n=1 Tax=Ruminococcus flavefaciens TaxID=1265 RepID=UPI00048FE01C|nr:ABC transporter permease subunit [Ruminococcus flavefaciens]MBQ3856015.1 ABC transporter permease subunit [Ruminococcus sp.]